MSNDKRFILVKCVQNNWGIVDTSLESIDQLILIHSSKSTVVHIIGLLNQLNDGNSELGRELRVCKNKNYELESYIQHIENNYEYSHGMSLRNADWM